jgi:hypothetical protein
MALGELPRSLITKTSMKVKPEFHSNNYPIIFIGGVNLGFNTKWKTVIIHQVMLFQVSLP